MLRKKGMKLFSFSLLAVICLLSSCVSNEKKIVNHYYLSLSGESKTWKVDSYEIIIKPETFKAGNGNLTMNKMNEYSTDFFNVKVVAVIANKDKVIQARSVSGSESDISQTSMGASGGGAFLYKNLEDINDIYMIIEWEEKNKTMKEKIDLFSEEKFFN
ncbi:hypothetical protein [Pontibacillus salipaludis]|uniref:Lipoprotein n=1 Tax=Pontibacillus salipaludis TaxID=1697394 RepID=A0ABQ1Q5L1_9BACI|nr:hypothetical protein [Pontibacillus salipaludis]GGD13575.1 hypothetical protein GCM10011389_21510 [Pontibacillus salipaludis]